MESLLIGGLQGLLNYAGLSFLDKMNIKKYQRKMKEGTATMAQCAKVVSNLKSDKDAEEKIIYLCDQLLNKNHQTLFANVNLGVIAVKDLIEAGYDKKILLNTGKFLQSKILLENAIKISKDPSIVEHRYEIEDLQVLSMLYSMMNYNYGYLLHLQGNVSESNHYKELGQKQLPGMGGLPYQFLSKP